MALTWSDIERMGEDFFCEQCGKGFESGEWICEIDGFYYHEGDCIMNAFGIQVPEPPEPPEFDCKEWIENHPEEWEKRLAESHKWFEREKMKENGKG